MKPDDGGSGGMQPHPAGTGPKRPDAEPWRDLRISKEPERIKLGGKRVLSFADVAQIIEPEPRYSCRLDWNAIALSCAMTPVESRMFLSHWRDGVPVYRLARRFGISQYEVGKLYRRIQIKLGINAQAIGGCLSIEPNYDSLRPAYRDHLPSGCKSWSLTKLGPEFASIMAEEKYIHVISERDPMEFQKSPRVWTVKIGAHMTTATLRSSFADEKAKAARLSERVHSCRLTRENAERALDKAQAESKAEQARAVLDEKEEFVPSAETRKRLAQAQTALAAAQADLEATIEAHLLQQIKCEELEAKINARRHEEFAAASKEIVERLRRTMPAFSADVFALQTLAYEAREDWPMVVGLFLPPAIMLPGFSGDANYIRISTLLLAASAFQCVALERKAAIGK